MDVDIYLFNNILNSKAKTDFEQMLPIFDGRNFTQNL